MSHDYIPSRQLVLKAWLENLDHLAGLSPNRYGLLQAEYDSLHLRILAFLSALALALAEDTRNKNTIAAKNMARVEMLQLLRPTCQRVRLDMGVAPEDKLALGLTLIDSTPTVVVAPTTAPVLAVGMERALVHTIRYHDDAMPTSRAKPRHTIGMQLVRIVTETATMPPGPATALPVAFISRQPHRVEYDPADARKTAWYWARWQTGKGLVGPWSDPASRTIGA